MNVPFKSAVSNMIGDFVENSSEPNVYENQSNRIGRSRSNNCDSADRRSRVHAWNREQEFILHYGNRWFQQREHINSRLQQFFELFRGFGRLGDYGSFDD